MKTIRCGADPEVFLCNTKGKLISSIGYINAGKENPLQIPDMPPGFTLQEDNVSLEYGIPPAASADEFVHNIQAVMEASKKYIGKLSFSKLSCHIFTKDQMRHPNAYIFGCEPDFNAWTGEQNPKPVLPHDFMRSAGGHIHVEVPCDGKDDQQRVVQYMDLYLSVPAVIMDQGEERKKLYGAAGAYRPKSYGVEYRSLSNFWIFDEKLIRWAFRNTERAVNSNVPLCGDLITKAINENNKELAWSLVNEYQLEVV